LCEILALKLGLLAVVILAVSHLDKYGIARVELHKLIHVVINLSESL
jgi:uncharacterized membrane protein (Fun14 family)